MPRSGFFAELGEGDRVVALRADMDALPIPDRTDDPWRSAVPDVAHACGHDVHVAALVGAALALAEVHERGELPGSVRLLFQPAEEVMPGGAKHLIAQGALEGVERVFALHCDPAVDVGKIGLRAGALTSAADRIEVWLEGTGGHTSRPHLTGDLTFALAKVTSELPAVLSRRMDPRAGVSVVWGILRAGAAPNVIPERRDGRGHRADPRRRGLGPVRADHPRGGDRHRPPLRRDAPRSTTCRACRRWSTSPSSNAVLAAAVLRVLGVKGQVSVPQSLGGEDYGWMLEQVPGAMFRLGTRTPGGATYDLHQGDFRVDERAIGIGARVQAEAVMGALSTP